VPTFGGETPAPTFAGSGAAAPLRVFVSATPELRDFPKGNSYVAAVERAISATGHVVVDLPGLEAIDRPPEQMYADVIRGCDVYVGLLGTRYGSPVADRPDVSYPELGFETATAAGLPRLMFLLDTNADTVEIPPAQLIDREFGAQQDAFRSRVQASNLTAQPFVNPAQLGQLVERALRELVTPTGPGGSPGNASFAGSGDAVRWRVFVSATSELRNNPQAGSYVAAVERAITAAGHAVVDLASFPATDRPPAEVDIDAVRECDVFVGLLGTRYGSPVRDRPDVSYSELEFETASAAGLPRLMFLLDTDADTLGIPPAQLIDREFGARQEAFRYRVQGELVTQSFANPDQLGVLVERALRELATRIDAGGVPQVRNIPARDPGFIGREELLETLRARLVAGDRPVALVLQGMAGVGKTQVAVEYAYRFADSYDVAWWVDCSEPGLIGEGFAALGVALGSVQPGAGTDLVRKTVLAELLSRDRWLLVFDNAEDPADIRSWLPVGGHVLITSRDRRWAELATPVDVDELPSEEAAAILHARVPGLRVEEARRLANELGNLPLALVQAATFMGQTGQSYAEYLQRLETRPGQTLREGAPASYGRSLAAAIELIADRLDRADPAAAQLAGLCAFLADKPIPEDLFTNAAGDLPGELAARVADPSAWRQTLASLTRQSLARIDQRGLQMHWLTQGILRDRLAPDQAAATRERTEAILAASDPSDPANPATWPRWAQLMPHLVAAGLADTSNPRLRRTASNACYYLLARGDTGTGHDLADGLRQRWRERLGDDQDTLTAASYLAVGLRNMGRYAEARELDQDTLVHRRRLFGDDHPSTLSSAHNLAVDLRELGDAQAARDLDEDTLLRRRRVLGEDHPYTLQSASSLASDLRLLEQVQTARELDEDTLARKSRVLGDEHPSTLTSASNLAIDLRLLEDVRTARQLDEYTLARKRRVLGDDHPSTLTSASNLAIDLRLLEDVRTARQLDEDTLNRKRRVLGDDHPHTRISGSNLAEDLRLLGEDDEGS
jgi:hypothetical protein